ncbi:MAG: BlaI/MecI/CopY family transcriptional regulator [Oscillospiraceae bacterium]
MEQIRISDAELKLMEYIWQTPGVRAAQLVELAREDCGWTKNTTYTLLKRMVDKGVIAREDPGFACTPLIDRELVCSEETNTLIDRLYEGSRKMFLASFLRREKLTEDEIDEIRRIIDESK